MAGLIDQLLARHNIGLVLVAVALCLFGTWTAFTIIQRSREASENRLVWLAGAGVATGATIWSTHFIAMRAYASGPDARYDVELTILSLVLAIGFSVAGTILAFALGRPTPRVAGGAVVGTGIGAMHFTGIAAINGLQYSYDPVLVVAACASGVALTVAAFAVEARVPRRWQAIVGSASMTAAIGTMHFAGMAALSTSTHLHAPPLAVGVSSNMLVIAVVAVSLLLLLLAFGATVLGRKLFELIELANAAHEGVLIAQGGLLIGANDAARAFFAEGGTHGEIVGRPMAELLPDRALDGASATSQPSAEYEMNLPAGVFPIELSARGIMFRGGESRVYVFTDLRERKAAQARIEHLAHHDALTDLPNRILFEDRLDQAMARADRDGDIVAVMYLDLDRFKAVNDLYGHASGDDVLRWVADLLRAMTRQTDTVARLGGDEFAIVQTGVIRPKDVESLAKALLAAFESRQRSVSDHRSVGLSIGIALYPADGADAETLLRNADTAVYRVKQDGRGAYRFFEAAMNEALLDRQVMESELRLALSKDQMLLHYQPLYNVETMTVIAFEALVRWEHPTRGLMMPLDFIPIAEECGFIVELGRWVLNMACAEAASWGQPHIVSVNVSPAEFHQPGLVEQVRDALAVSGLPGNRLDLEITETVVMKNRATALATLVALRALGVGIVMDGFGTGFSSLSNLQAFPFDKIKIDRSFIENLEQSDHALSIVRSILGLGRSLGLPVVAEGVTNLAQLDILRSEQCAEVQGFLLGGPEPMKNYARHVARTNDAA